MASVPENSPVRLIPGSFLDNTIQSALTRGSKTRSALGSALGISDHSPSNEDWLKNEVLRMLTGIDKATNTRGLPDFGFGGITVGKKLRPGYEHSPEKLKSLKFYEEISQSHPNLPERRKKDLTGWWKSPEDDLLRTEYPDPIDIRKQPDIGPPDQYPIISRNYDSVTPEAEKAFRQLDPADPYKSHSREFEQIVDHPSFGYEEDFPITGPKPLEIPMNVTLKRVDPLFGKEVGGYDIVRDTIRAEAANTGNLNSLIGHETAHAAAAQSGLPRGTNPDSPSISDNVDDIMAEYGLTPDSKPSPEFVTYMSELGEQEARNYQNFRRKITADEKMMSFADDTLKADPYHKGTWIETRNELPVSEPIEGIEDYFK